MSEETQREREREREKEEREEKEKKKKETQRKKGIRKWLLLAGFAGCYATMHLIDHFAPPRATYTRLSPTGEILNQVRVLKRGEKSFDYKEYMQKRIKEEQAKINAYCEGINVYSNTVHEQHQPTQPAPTDPDLELYTSLEQNYTVSPNTAPVTNQVVSQPIVQETVIPTVNLSPTNQQILIDVETLPSHPVTIPSGAQVRFERKKQGRASIRIDGPLPAGSVLILHNLPETPQQAADQVVQTIRQKAAAVRAQQRDQRRKQMLHKLSTRGYMQQKRSTAPEQKTSPAQQATTAQPTQQDVRPNTASALQNKEPNPLLLARVKVARMQGGR